MNLADKKKFIDLFVEVTKYGQKTNVFDKGDVNGILKSIENSDDLLDKWDKFIYKKSELPELEDPDNWDNWYDNLTFDTLDEKDVILYDLPQNKIQVNFDGNEKSFIFELYGLANAFIEDCKPYCNPSTNIHASYDFCHEGIFINFYASDDCVAANGKKYDSKARTAVSEIYNKFTDKLKVVINKFNNAQDNSICAQYQAYNNESVRTNVSTARGIVISNEDLFYSNKNLVSQKDLDRIFGYINDSVDIY